MSQCKKFLKTKEINDRRTVKQRELKVAEKVMYRNSNKWQKGKIIKKAPRSLIIKNQFNTILRRNTSNLRYSFHQASDNTNFKTGMFTSQVDGRSGITLRKGKTYYCNKKGCSNGIINN